MRHVRKYKRLTKTASPMAGSTVEADAPITNGKACSSKRARNVVDALFTHFEKWQPQVAETAKLENCKTSENLNG